MVNIRNGLVDCISRTRDCISTLKSRVHQQVQCQAWVRNKFGESAQVVLVQQMIRFLCILQPSASDLQFPILSQSTCVSFRTITYTHVQSIAYVHVIHPPCMHLQTCMHAYLPTCLPTRTYLYKSFYAQYMNI